MYAESELNDRICNFIMSVIVEIIKMIFILQNKNFFEKLVLKLIGLCLDSHRKNHRIRGGSLVMCLSVLRLLRKSISKNLKSRFFSAADLL